MLTGENKVTAKCVSDQIGLAEYFAEVLPQDKAAKVKDVQSRGKRVVIPLAAGVLYACGVRLTPALGAVLMAASTVIVAVNARLLRLKAEPQPDKET